MKINEFKEGSDYRYSIIEQLLEEDDTLTCIEHGDFEIGNCFLVIKDDRGDNVSFVLTGYASQSIYTCIYNDYQR